MAAQAEPEQPAEPTADGVAGFRAQALRLQAEVEAQRAARAVAADPASMASVADAPTPVADPLTD